MKTTNALNITSVIVDIVLIALLAFALAKGFASPGLSVMIIAGIVPRRIAPFFKGILKKIIIWTIGIAALSSGAILWLREILSTPDVSLPSIVSLVVLWLLGLAVAACNIYAVALPVKH